MAVFHSLYSVLIVQGGKSGLAHRGMLTAENLGWHLPCFVDSFWATSPPSEGFSGADVKFTALPSHASPGWSWCSFAFEFSTNEKMDFRTLLYLYMNRSQYTRFSQYLSFSLRLHSGAAGSTELRRGHVWGCAVCADGGGRLS